MPDKMYFRSGICEIVDNGDEVYCSGLLMVADAVIGVFTLDDMCIYFVQGTYDAEYNHLISWQDYKIHNRARAQSGYVERAFFHRGWKKGRIFQTN